MKDNFEKEFIDMFKKLRDMLEYSYNDLSYRVDLIINNRETNIHLIESTLDNILSNFIDERFYDLFLKLCNYYKLVNEKNALDYMYIYYEEIGEYKEEIDDKIR